MPKIQAVAIDVDGTLVTLRAGIGELYSEALRGGGIHISPGRLQDCVLWAWRNFEGDYLNVREEFATNPAREMLLWHEFIRRVLEDSQAGLGRREDLIASVYSYFSAGSSRQVTPGALEVCRSLRDRGLTVIAASNNDARTAKVLHELGFGECLSWVVTAGELGWKKPSPRFFKALSQWAGVRPEEMLHVGNSLRLDVEAARDAGMQALLLAPGKSGDKGTIGDLRELVMLCL